MTQMEKRPLCRAHFHYAGHACRALAACWALPRSKLGRSQPTQLARSFTLGDTQPIKLLCFLKWAQLKQFLRAGLLREGLQKAAEKCAQLRVASRPLSHNEDFYVIEGGRGLSHVAHVAYLMYGKPHSYYLVAQRELPRLRL
jgi:hypothetical protein